MLWIVANYYTPINISCENALVIQNIMIMADRHLHTPYKKTDHLSTYFVWPVQRAVF